MIIIKGRGKTSNRCNTRALSQKWFGSFGTTEHYWEPEKEQVTNTTYQSFCVLCCAVYRCFRSVSLVSLVILPLSVDSGRRYGDNCQVPTSPRQFFHQGTHVNWKCCTVVVPFSAVRRKREHWANTVANCGRLSTCNPKHWTKGDSSAEKDSRDMTLCECQYWTTSGRNGQERPERFMWRNCGNQYTMIAKKKKFIANGAKGNSQSEGQTVREMANTLVHFGHLCQPRTRMAVTWFFTLLPSSIYPLPALPVDWSARQMGLFSPSKKSWAVVFFFLHTQAKIFSETDSSWDFQCDKFS